MAKNIELLKRLRTRFLRMRHLEHFNMRVIAAKDECGTAMCVAGHTLDLEGYKVRFPRSDEEDTTWLSPSGEVLDDDDALTRARELLGLEYDEAEAIRNRDEDCGIFYDFSLKTPKDAARRIEQIIAEAES